MAVSFKHALCLSLALSGCEGAQHPEGIYAYRTFSGFERPVEVSGRISNSEAWRLESEGKEYFFAGFDSDGRLSSLQKRSRQRLEWTATFTYTGQNLVAAVVHEGPGKGRNYTYSHDEP